MKYETLRAADFIERDDDIAILKTVTDGHCGLHAHDFVELEYVVSGQGHHTVGGERDFIQKGDFFIFNANVPHEYISEGGSPIIVYNCIFKPESVDRSIREGEDFLDVAYCYLFHSFYSKDNPRCYLKFTGVRSRSVRKLLDDMYEEYQGKQKGYKQMLKSDLTKLLILAFRMYKEEEGQGQSAPVLRRLVVHNAVKYMEAAYASPITCEQLADRAYLSVSYFNKIFKEETGLTALRLLQKIRMEAAAFLLSQTDLPITQVAEEVGYADAKFFYKIFKSHNGLTPGDYRKEHKGKAK